MNTETIEQLIENLKPVFYQTENARRYWEQKFIESRKASERSWGDGTAYSKAEKYNYLSDELKKVLNHLETIKTKILFLEEEQKLLSECYQELNNPHYREQAYGIEPTIGGLLG